MKAKVAIISVIYLALSVALGSFLNSTYHPGIELAAGPLRGLGSAIREVKHWSSYGDGVTRIEPAGIRWAFANSAIFITGLVLINKAVVRRNTGITALLVLLWMASGIMNSLWCIMGSV